MNIKIKKENGYIQVNLLEVEQFVAQQLQMVPGINEVGPNSICKRIKGIIRNNAVKGVFVKPIREETVVIECHVNMVAGINFTDVAHQAQEIIIYSVEKYYGIKVASVDIYVEGITI